jgi:hypothetical protein
MLCREAEVFVRVTAFWKNWKKVLGEDLLWQSKIRVGCSSFTVLALHVV